MIHEIQDFLQPFKTIPAINHQAQTVTSLLNYLKQYSDEIADLPKGNV